MNKKLMPGLHSLRGGKRGWGLKRILFGMLAVTMMSSCFIFKKKEKYGCPANGRSMGAEKIASGDPKAVKLSNKAKFRGN